MNTQSVITRTITVAGGRFAPGHLGELTQHLPFEIVDEALTATRTTQSRLRDLPSRVMVYLLLAACLFPEVGYPGVWRKLTAAPGDLPTATPTPRGLATARQHITAAPLRWLFDLLRGPAATGRAPSTRWRGLLVCAIDRTTLTVPDTHATLTAFTKHRGNHGGTGYPQTRLVALLACGTRTWPAIPTARTSRRWAGCECASSTARSPSPPRRDARPASTGWPPPASTRTATQPPS